MSLLARRWELKGEGGGGRETVAGVAKPGEHSGLSVAYRGRGSSETATAPAGESVQNIKRNNNKKEGTSFSSHLQT
jgi:hypothetical protein